MQPFRFLDLSAEMRNLVYEAALTGEDGEITINASAPPTTQTPRPSLTETFAQQLATNTVFYDETYVPLRDRPIPAPFAFIYTCKQIWNEAKSLPYELNRVRFLVKNESQVLRLDRALRSAPEKIKSITIDFATIQRCFPDQLQALRKIFKIGIDMYVE